MIGTTPGCGTEDVLAAGVFVGTAATIGVAVGAGGVWVGVCVGGGVGGGTLEVGAGFDA